MIIETVVTTIAEDGTLNCAPMGVEWGDDHLVLKPFLETATYRNLVCYFRFDNIRTREPFIRWT